MCYYCGIFKIILYLWVCNNLNYIFSETYDEKTPAEIRREKDKERYAAMSVSDKQEKISKYNIRRTIK